MSIVYEYFWIFFVSKFEFLYRYRIIKRYLILKKKLHRARTGKSLKFNPEHKYLLIFGENESAFFASSFYLRIRLRYWFRYGQRVREGFLQRKLDLSTSAVVQRQYCHQSEKTVLKKDHKSVFKWLNENRYSWLNFR